MIDPLPRMGVILRGQNASYGWKLGSHYFAAHGAGSHRDLCIVANAFYFAHVAASHDVELARFFSKPDGRGDLYPILAKGGK